MINRLNVFRYYLKFRYGKYISKKQLQFFQKKMINRHLSFVTDNSPFYHRFRGKMLESLPIIDRKTITDNFDIINTVGISREDAISLAEESERDISLSDRLNNIRIRFNYGKTNDKDFFIEEEKETEKKIGFVLAEFLENGVTAKYNVAFFTDTDSGICGSMSFGNIKLLFLNADSDMSTNMDKLRSFFADVIIAPASVLLNIAEEKKEGRLEINPETIVAVTKILKKEDEEVLRDVFGIAVIHQLYQCEEGYLASTCRFGTLHLNEDMVYIEKEYVDKRRFIPIVTDFEKNALPVIRCRLNHVFYEKEYDCPCGCVFTALEKNEE